MSAQQVVSNTGRPWRLAGWSLVPPTVGTVLAGAWAASVPGGYFGIGLWVVLAWLVLGCCWLVVAIVTLVLDVRAGRLRQRARGYWRLALVPALTVLWLLLAELDLTQRARFAIDRAELEAYAGQVRDGRVDTEQAGPIGRIGTLRISSVQDFQGCVRFTVADAGFLSQNGYAHCTGAPVEDSAYSYRHLAGQWFSWAFSD